MECMKPQSNESTTRRKLSKKFSKFCIDPQTPSRLFTPPPTRLKTLSEELNISLKDVSPRSHTNNNDNDNDNDNDSDAAKAALVAKLFASVSSIKAAYAELQCAQFPYNAEAIHNADEDLVQELVLLSEIKHKYMGGGGGGRRRLDLPPPCVALLLAEIQEQHSSIKTYEITIKQMECKLQQKAAQIHALRREFEDVTNWNKSLEKRLNSSGALFPLREDIALSELSQCHFIRVLNSAVRSLRHFIKHLVREMETRNWDMDLAAKAIIQRDSGLRNPKHRVFTFESYVARIIFDGFNHRNFFLPDEGGSKQNGRKNPQFFFDSFVKMQSLTTTKVFREYPKCPFARFCKGKYLKAVHPKMECSIFGNLDQRKVISSGAFPETEFFSLFAEMARRVWLLHCLAFSFDPPAVAFQVKRGCRFSEVYMESVAGDEDVVASEREYMAVFTVVPGFKIGKTVVQSLVYTCPINK
ncbi:hypothetical protein vseg_008908 [Gypsophila vaccaria]